MYWGGGRNLAAKGGMRGYSATAFTHGKLNVLMTEDIFEILARPQFRNESIHVRRHILRAQVRGSRGGLQGV